MLQLPCFSCCSLHSCRLFAGYFIGIKFKQVTNFIGIKFKQVTNFTLLDDVAPPALSVHQSAVQPGKLRPPQGFFSWIKSVVRG